MTIFATLGAYAGVALLVLMALTPLLADLSERYPVARRVKPIQAVKATAQRASEGLKNQGATLASA